MTTHIITHIMPNEIDDFEWQSKQLKIGSQYLNEDDKIFVDVTLNLNFFDEDSILPKSFFIKKFFNLVKFFDWCEHSFNINEDNTCLGCGDKRKQSIQNSTSDNIIYLDSDIIFKPETLSFLLEARKNVTNEYFIISPQCPRTWDHSWDVLANDNFKYIPSHENYSKVDPFTISTKDSIYLSPIPTFKFAGGWFNLLSTNLLKLTDIPESLNPYGPDDTYVMGCCEILKKRSHDIQQYILKNLTISENIRYKNNLYSEFLKINNKKENFREKTEKNLFKEIIEFGQKINNL